MLKILITGAGGQDGRLLVQQLGVEQSIEIHQTARKPLATEGLGPNVHSHLLDVTDSEQVNKTLHYVQPDVVYHLAGSSSVAHSWSSPQESLFVNSIGTTNVLESSRSLRSSPRLVLAGSSEVFGRGEFVASEDTPLNPSSPYGISKAMNVELARLYRNVYGMDVITLIMFNHESHFRPREFVSKEIATQAALIKQGKASHIELRNPDASKDWGSAHDFVSAMARFAKKGDAADYVLATSRRTSARQLAEFALLGLDLDPTLVKASGSSAGRPNDESHPVGDFSKVNLAVGWAPTRSPEQFMAEMARQAFEEVDPRAHGIRGKSEL